MEPVTIRLLTREDQGELENLYKKLTLSEFPEYTPNTRQYFTKEYMHKHMKSSVKIGAFVNNILVGYLIAGQTEGGVMFIYWLAIAPDFQRKGMGKQMLAEIEKIALSQGAHTIHLESAHKNCPFYLSQGYEQFGFDKESYYGADSYLLKKMLRKAEEKNFLKDYLRLKEE